MLTKLEAIIIRVILSLDVIVRKDVLLLIIPFLMLFVIVLALVSLKLLIEKLIIILLLANMRGLIMIIPFPLLIEILFHLDVMIFGLLLISNFNRATP
jgi:hypothetical protein